MSEQAKFLEGSLFRHITVMSLTASVGLMAVFLVDFVDMIFISMLGKAELAAAVGYAGAILFFTTSFGIGMAIAAGALVARDLGAGDEAKARLQATHSLIYGVVFGAIFAAPRCLARQPYMPRDSLNRRFWQQRFSSTRIIFLSLPAQHSPGK